MPPASSLRRLPEQNTMIYNLCYLSVLQRPPAPQVVNAKKDVLVTIEQFWLSDYWRKLKPSNLTLIYEFPVAVSGKSGGRVF
jgi:hypothetical protein